MMATTERATAQQVARLRDRIAEAEAAANRPAGSVRLLAVSKTHPPAACLDALAAGIDDLAENRVQELDAKAAVVAEHGVDVRWHLVGPLQSNKVGLVVNRGWLLHAIDRSATVARVARLSAVPSLQPVLIQVNVGADPAKSGCTPAQAPALVDEAARAGLDVRGLMTVPPIATDPRRHFAALRELAASLQRDHVGLTELSMGMSGDFEAAIAEGATMVRIGAAIFGPRGTAPWSAP